MSAVPAGVASLLALADQRTPSGGHVHSGGVEEAVRSRLVSDGPTLRAFLRRRLASVGLVTAGLAAAADGDAHDDDLRRRTAEACDRLAGLEGTPMLHLSGRPFFGPVLTAVPRGDDARRLWDAVRALAAVPGFAELRTVRDEHLRTA